MSIVANIVGRLHVSESNFDVVRTIYYAIDKRQRRDPTKRKMRKAAYREGIKIHAKNRKVYKQVMLRNP